MRISVEHNPYCVGNKWEVAVEVSHKEILHSREEVGKIIKALEEAAEKAFGKEKQE